MKKLFLLSIFVVLCTVVAHATLPLGSVTSVSTMTCPGGLGFIIGDDCSSATLVCPGTVSLPLVYSYENPGRETPIIGTFVYFAAGQGTTLSGEMIDTLQPSLLAAGYQVIKFVWSTTWWTTSQSSLSIQTAACRGATLGTYFYNSVHTTGLFNVACNSAGSAECAYWLAWYGGASMIHLAELFNGPVFSDISQGCQFPQASNVNIVPSNGAQWSAHVFYPNSDASTLTTDTGIQCLNPGGTTPTQNAAWLAMSIVQPGWLSSYPNTILHAWVCNNNLNNSEAQGWIFYSNLTSAYMLTAISGCLNAEDVADGVTPQGVNGLTAILADMLEDP